MSDPLNSIVYIDEVHIENGNENSRKRSLPDEFEDYSGDDSVGNSYIKVKINKTKILEKANLLEKQNKILRARLEDVTDENLALRENNVKFQVKIFRLQRKINELEAGEEPKQSYYGDEFLGIYEEPQKILKTPKIEMPPPKSQDKTKKSKKPAKKAQISKPPSYSSSADSSEEDEKEDTQNIKPKVVLPVWKDIKISKSKQKELDQIPQGHKGDSKYVCKMLTTLWDSVTLIESSVTGNPARGPGSNWSAKPLDPIRLRYLKYAFKKRLDKENLEDDDLETRTKRVNTLIKNKINNLRKSRKSKTVEPSSLENSVLY